MEGSSISELVSLTIHITTIDVMILRTFVQGLIPAIQDIVTRKESTSLEVAIAWIQKKKSNFANLQRRKTFIIAAPRSSVEASKSRGRAYATATPSSESPAVAKLMKEF